MFTVVYAVYCVKLIFFKDKYSFPLGEYIIEVIVVNNGATDGIAQLAETKHKNK